MSGPATISDRVAWFASLSPSGSPHMTPVWMIFDEDVFWVASQVRSVKTHNVAQDPRVAIAIDGSAAAPIVAEGRATTMGDPALFPDEVVRAFQVKYDWDITDAAPNGPLVLMRVPVTRWILDGRAAD